MSKFSEYLSVRHDNGRVELVELTDTMAENLSEIATLVSVETIGGKATVWKNRTPRVVAVDGGTIAELKRRAVWRDERLGWVS